MSARILIVPPAYEIALGISQVREVPVPKWEPIPNTERSAWKVCGLVVRKQHGAYFVRKDNGTGWGNGDLVTVCHNRRQVNEAVVLA